MSRIVVVEDDPHILRVITLWLTRQGHEVLEAPNGKTALEIIQQQPPDLIVTDVNMPGMDGFELLAELDRLGRRPGGVLMLTSRWDHREIASRLSEQGVRVMPKPFSPTALSESVRELIDGMGSTTRLGATDEGRVR